MKTAHTPGPWIYEERCSGIAIAKPGDEEVIVASIHPQDDDDECTDEDEANAKLISAAPDLLKALQDIKSRSRLGIIKKIADAAIKKATE